MSGSIHDLQDCPRDFTDKLFGFFNGSKLILPGSHDHGGAPDASERSTNSIHSGLPSVLLGPKSYAHGTHPVDQSAIFCVRRAQGTLDRLAAESLEDNRRRTVQQGPILGRFSGRSGDQNKRLHQLRVGRRKSPCYVSAHGEPQDNGRLRKPTGDASGDLINGTATRKRDGLDMPTAGQQRNEIVPKGVIQHKAG